MTQTALVTGGSQGLGAAISRALHDAGYRVAVSDIDETAARRLARELDPSGVSAEGFSLDVREQAGFEQVRDELLRRWGSVEILVNNAVMTAAKPVLDITPEEFDAVLAVNLRGTFIGSQVFGRLFKGKRYGRIVNIASLAGQNGGTATGAHYAASKGGILTLTKVFARDLAPFGITVNAVAPGPLESPAVHRTVLADRLAQLIQAIPTGALGDVGFVADIVVRLASPDAGFTTGATWDINGGLLMR